MSCVKYIKIFLGISVFLNSVYLESVHINTFVLIWTLYFYSIESSSNSILEIIIVYFKKILYKIGQFFNKQEIYRLYFIY